jgi:hypothetical protein
MSTAIGLVADLLVAILLVATILTCLRLSQRLRRLRADEQAMRATIVDLLAATATAERAIGSLRASVAECDGTLAERLRAAERYSTDLAEQVSAGEAVMDRVARIVGSSRRVVDPSSVPVAAPPRPANVDRSPDLLQAAAAAAQAVSERTARRIEGRAA